MNKNQNNGFTLMEMMITLVIAGITMAIAIPSMNDFLKNDRITSFRNAFHVDLMVGRSKAVEMNQSVFVCSSSDQVTCGGGSLEDGWIVAIDTDNSGAIEATDTLVKAQTAIPGDINFVDGGLNTIIFDGRGFAPNSIGAISVCDDRGNSHAKTLSISRTGRVSNGANPSC